MLSLKWPDCLVAALFHDGWRQPLVGAHDPLRSDYTPHPVEEALKIIFQDILLRIEFG